jgi:hypothetical protein
LKKSVGNDKAELRAQAQEAEPIAMEAANPMLAYNPFPNTVI